MIPIQEIDVSTLSSRERLQLAQMLLDSVLASAVEPLTPEQTAELDRRLALIDSGQAHFEPWSAVRERLLKSQ